MIVACPQRHGSNSGRTAASNSAMPAIASSRNSEAGLIRAALTSASNPLNLRPARSLKRYARASASFACHSCSRALSLRRSEDRMEPTTITTTNAVTRMASPASDGFRRPHRQSRSVVPTGLARIGLFARNRPRSSARAAAVAYRLRGSFCRHLRQTVTRSRGACAGAVTERPALPSRPAAECLTECPPEMAAAR